MYKAISIIDCAIKDPAIESFNQLVEKTQLAFTYHNPSRTGMDSLLNAEPARAYIIFGSDSSANDNLPWQIQLSTFLKEKCEQGVPVFGLCFGHQLMTHAYGAKIERANQQASNKNIFVGKREINFIEDGFGFQKGQNFTYVVAHGEEVKNLPEDFIHLGTSDNVKYEAVMHKTFPLLSVQGHPEASLSFMRQETGTTLNEEDKEICMLDGYRILSTFINHLRVLEQKRGKKFRILKEAIF